jgi:hypothetical protein
MTSLPRPAIYGLLGVVLIAALFMFTRKGGNDQTASSPATASQPSATPAAPGGTAAAPSGSGTGTATPATPAKPATPSKTASQEQNRTLPTPVTKALNSHKIVVLLFWSKRGIDDRAVKSAVDGLPRHGGKVAVFTDDLKDLARYTKIAASANVTETPTLIVTNSKGQARVATGYLDPTTVEQYVVDALHGAP